MTTFGLIFFGFAIGWLVASIARLRVDVRAERRARARALAEDDSLSVDEIRRRLPYWARHEEDRNDEIRRRL